MIHFPRKVLADELVAALRGQTVFGDAQNGLFLAAPRRTGKSTFLQADLQPALEAAGAVVEYVVDPTFVGTKIRPGAEASDVQATMQGLLIMGLTGLRQPALLGDFGHLALDEEGRGAFARFRAELAALADEIDRKNLTRRFPYNGFNPRNLESSVSI